MKTVTRWKSESAEQGVGAIRISGRSAPQIPDQISMRKFITMLLLPGLFTVTDVSSQDCGACVAPGKWKQFMCHCTPPQSCNPL